MMGVCRDVTVALAVPQNEINRDCPYISPFHTANRTMGQLCDLTAGKKILIETEQINEAENSSRIQVAEYAGRNPKAEAAFAAAETVRLIREEGYRYRDIAIVTADMETYGPYLQELFRQEKVPVYANTSIIFRLMTIRNMRFLIRPK